MLRIVVPVDVPVLMSRTVMHPVPILHILARNGGLQGLYPRVLVLLIDVELLFSRPSRARARTRAKKPELFGKSTPEESDDPVLLFAFNGVFTPRDPSVSHLFSDLITYECLPFHRFVQKGPLPRLRAQAIHQQ